MDSNSIIQPNIYIYIYASWEKIVHMSAYGIRFHPFTVVEIYWCEIAVAN